MSRGHGLAIDQRSVAAAEVLDVQLERAVDVLKGIMVFEAKNGSRSWPWGKSR